MDLKSCSGNVVLFQGHIGIPFPDGCDNRKDRVALGIYETTLKGKKPLSDKYPTELVTLGDHLRKVRLDKGLLQQEVADILQVDKETILCWELNRNTPTAKYAKRIILFLGYIPEDWKSAPLQKQLMHARLVEGITQEELAKKLGMDESNLAKIEGGKKKKIWPKTISILKDFIESRLNMD